MMMKKTCLSLSFMALLSLGSAASAQDMGNPWKTFASFGYTAGGDILVNGNYSDTGKSYTLKAGNGWQGMLGAQYNLATDWTAQVALGYHYDRTNGVGGNFKYTRWPLQLSAHYALSPNWRLGVGMHQSQGVKFESIGSRAPFGNYTMKSRLAPLAEVQYLLFPLENAGAGLGAAGGVSLKWVDERFEVQGLNGFKRDGKHLAISLFTYF